MKDRNGTELKPGDRVSLKGTVLLEKSFGNDVHIGSMPINVTGRKITTVAPTLCEKDSARPWFVQGDSHGILMVWRDSENDAIMRCCADPIDTAWRLVETWDKRGLDYAYIGVQLMRGSRATLIYKDSQPTLEEAREALRRFDEN